MLVLLQMMLAQQVLIGCAAADTQVLISCAAADDLEVCRHWAFGSAAAHPHEVGVSAGGGILPTGQQLLINPHLTCAFWLLNAC